MVDYHMHTPLCHHAQGSPAEYLEVARQRGLREIGFADHYPLDLLGIKPRNKVTMSSGELAGYIEEIWALGESADGIKVKLGVEVDFIPGKERESARLLQRDNFDFVIGSIHFIDRWDFTHPLQASRYETSDLALIYRSYFELLWQACSSGLFDIIGHLDVVKKFGYRLSPEEMEPLWQRTAELLREKDLAFELNTSGRAVAAAEFYPGRRMLEICRRAGVPVTLGSDAHAPEQVGRYFDEALELLREVGYRELAVFSARRRSYLPL